MRHVSIRARLVAVILAAGGPALVLAVATLATQPGAGGVTVPAIPQIFVVSSSSGATRQLTSGNVTHSNAFWFPSGHRIGELASRAPWLTWMESQTSSGTSARTLSSTLSTPNTGPAMTYSPPAHTTAAAVFNENQSEDTLELLGARGTRPIVIDRFPDAGGGPSTPVWSPDGTTIAYARPQLQSPTVGMVNAGPNQIALFDLQTRTRRILAAGSRDASAPLFSPDGKWILFTKGSGNYRALEVARVKGGPPRRIASNVELLVSAAWSPDGRNIAFTGYTKGDLEPYLFDLNVRTKRLRKLTNNMQLLTPSWSPDSTEIAFATWFTALTPAPPQGYGAVEIIKANGTDPRVLVRAPGSQTNDLAWAPDGSTIAFTLQPAPTGD